MTKTIPTPEEFEQLQGAYEIVHQAMDLAVTYLHARGVPGAPAQLVPMIVSCGMGAMVAGAPNSAPELLRGIIGFYERREATGKRGMDLVEEAPENAQEIVSAYNEEVRVMAEAMKGRDGATVN